MIKVRNTVLSIPKSGSSVRAVSTPCSLYELSLSEQMTNANVIVE